MLRHPIHVVSRLTGLSPHVIRIWEKRYAAVKPDRSQTNRRLYTDEDIARLRLLARATEAGHRIGTIAQLTSVDLRRLIDSLQGEPRNDRPLPKNHSVRRGMEGDTGARGLDSGRSAGGNHDPAPGLVQRGVEAIRSYNSDALIRVLEEGAMSFGCNGVLIRVVSPLADELGNLWRRAEITAAHEHFASGILREFLGRCARSFATGVDAPRLIVATPAGQLHELGAVMVSAAACNLGWRSIYLGASLPHAEIAGAAAQNEARLILLSIVFPADDPSLPLELRQLRRLVSGECQIVVGGRAAPAYSRVLEEIQAIVPRDFADFCDLLASSREFRAAHAEAAEDPDFP